ncbi:unnamed protein product [Phytophthora fragariaefolia]|uniref:Unnamed protein product n=1 Tax=Phytophthora fragariaefolia TaxID=1490495 RepID=A0A9W6Y046_9STRA|nr:unnamed protein product [Phytophthora fragariaefolia]
MTLDRRQNYGIKAVKGSSAGVPTKFASIQERRVMKKVAQPEHVYTGCVPYTPDDDESDGVPKKKNPPILGYRGHLRHDEDRIGTTFTQGLVIASRSAEQTFPLSSTKARSVNNQPRQVHFADDKNRQRKPTGADKVVDISPWSGYGQFDHASGYGNFAAPPLLGGNKSMSPRSGYGAFYDASGYGAFAPPPARGGLSDQSGYGEFEDVSGYGAFAAPPPKGGMSPRSGYGAFEDASGYGAFAAPPQMSPRPGYRDPIDKSSGNKAFAGSISSRSGYDAFDNTIGYSAFAARPAGMSPRSGYGAFDDASGYGAFAAHPAEEGMSPRSGYGGFDNVSGYGAFAAPPEAMSPRSGYDKFDDASGYGHFASPPVSNDEKQGNCDSPSGNLHTHGNHTRQSNQTKDHQQQQRQRSASQTNMVRSTDPILQAKYQQAMVRIGGEQAALRLWVAAAQTIWQRHTKRTELLQAVKRSFEKHERTSTLHIYLRSME